MDADLQAMNDFGKFMLVSGTVALLLCLAFLPALTAGLRGHHNALAIFMVNLLFGWTILGWMVALVWACTSTDASRTEVRRPRRRYHEDGPLQPW